MSRSPLAVIVALMVGACQSNHQAPQANAAPTRPVRIIAADYSYGIGSDTLQAGWHDILVVNQGKAPHMAVIVRLDSGKTLNDVVTAVKTNHLAPWITEVGGVNAVLPGDSLQTALNLPAGNYVIGCFVPDSTGKPHFLDGMVAGFTVGSSGVSAIAEPVADDTVRLTSYAITFSAPPRVGTHVYRVNDVDTAPVDHDFVVVRVQDGKTTSDVLAWLDKMGGTPPPFSVAGATTGMAPGVYDDVFVDLTPGNYLAVCLMGDAKDGKPHFRHGMVAAFTIPAQGS